MNTDEIVGVVGASLVALSFLPQTYRTVTTFRAEDISPAFIGLNIISCAMMLWYGFREWSYPVLVSNGSVMVNLITISYVKVSSAQPCSSTHFSTLWCPAREANMLVLESQGHP